MVFHVYEINDSGMRFHRGSFRTIGQVIRFLNEHHYDCTVYNENDEMILVKRDGEIFRVRR